MTKQTPELRVRLRGRKSNYASQSAAAFHVKVMTSRSRFLLSANLVRSGARFLISGLVAAICLAGTASPVRADLPGTAFSDDGLRDFEKGMIAAQSRLWAQAIQAFGQAQADAPINPDALYNLGLAYLADNQPLVGVPWLKAYLAVAPDAPNAAAVEQEIRRQMLGWQVRIDAIVDHAFEAGMLLPKDDWIRNRALTGMQYRVGSAGYGGDIHRIARAIENEDALAVRFVADAADAGRFFADTELADLCRVEIARLNLEACPDLIARMSDKDHIGVRSEAIAEYALALFRAGRVEEAERQLSEITAQRRLDVIRQINPQGTLTAEEKSVIASQLELVMRDLPAGSEAPVVVELLRHLGRHDEAERWTPRKKDAAELREDLKDASGWDRLELLIDMGELDLARTYLEEEVTPDVERNGGSVVGKRRIAGYYADIVTSLFERDRTREAQRLIDQVPPAYTERYEFEGAYLAWAKWHCRRGDLDMAVEVMNRALHPFHISEKSQILSGFVAQAVLEGDLDKAVRATTGLKWRGEGRYPDRFFTGSTFERTTHVLIEDNALDQALAFLEALVQRDRLWPELVTPLAEALAKAGRVEEAARLVERDFGKAGFHGVERYASNLVKVASAMISAGDAALAEPILAKAESALGTSLNWNADIWISLAKVWSELGRKDRAREAVDRATRDLAASGRGSAEELATEYAAIIGENELAAGVRDLATALGWISLARELEEKREIQSLDEKIRTVAQGDPQKAPEGLATIARHMGQALTMVIRREREVAVAN